MPDPTDYVSLPDDSTLIDVSPDGSSATYQGPKGARASFPTAILHPDHQDEIRARTSKQAEPDGPSFLEGFADSPLGQLGQSAYQAMQDPLVQGLMGPVAAPLMAARGLGSAGTAGKYVAGGLGATFGALGQATGSQALQTAGDYWLKQGGFQPATNKGPQVPVANFGDGPQQPVQPDGADAYAAMLAKMGSGQGTGMPGLPATKDYTGELEAAQKRGEQGLQALATQEQQARLGMAGNEREAATQHAQALADFQAHRQLVNDEYQANMKRLDDAQAKLDAQKDDPNRWWNSRNGGQKALAMLSLVLTGAASAMTGKNFTSPIFDLAKEDLESQRLQWNRDANSIAAKRSAYGQARQMGLDDAQASLLVQQGQIDQMLKAANSYDQAKLPGASQQRLAEFIAQAGQQSVMNKAALQNQAFGQSVQRASLAMQQQQMQQQRMMAQAEMAYRLNPNRLPGPTEVNIAGRNFDVQDKELAKELDATASSGQRFIAAVQKAREAAMEAGSSNAAANPKAYGKYQAALEDIQTLLNKSQGIEAVVGDSQRKQLEHAIGNDWLKPTDAVLSGLAAFEEMARSNVGLRFRQRRLPNPLDFTGERNPNEAQRSRLDAARLSGAR